MTSLKEMLQGMQDWDMANTRALTGIDLRDKDPEDPAIRRMPWKQPGGPPRPHWAVEQAVGGLPDNQPLVNESDTLAVTLASLIHPALRAFGNRAKPLPVNPTEPLSALEMRPGTPGGPGPTTASPNLARWLESEPPIQPPSAATPPPALPALEMEAGKAGGPGQWRTGYQSLGQPTVSGKVIRDKNVKDYAAGKKQ